MPSFFLFPAPPIFRVPLTLASSPLPESREQAWLKHFTQKSIQSQCQLKAVILLAIKDSKCGWCVSIYLLSQL